MAPRVPSDGLIRVHLLLLQAHAGVHQIPPASNDVPDRKDGGTLQALQKIFAQHPLARDSTTTRQGRLHVDGPLAQNSTTHTRPRVEVLLHQLGLQRNPKKSLWEPTQMGDHLGLTIDL
jgi:hypothetical protein